MNADAPAEDTIFFDFDALVERDASGYRTRQEIKDWLGRSARHGLLANRPETARPQDLRWPLEDAGLWDRLDRDLVVLASSLPIRWPDPRVFAAAAALAERPPEQCRFITTDKPAAAAAAEAGMRTELLAAIEVAPRLAAEEEAPAAAAPSYVIEGRLVTMGSDGVIDEGRLAISEGQITAIARPGEDLPPQFADVPHQHIDGTIYPGLMDLHNHLAYNALPLWPVPQPYTNRSRWMGTARYTAEVGGPGRALARNDAETARALVRYVEAKALIGGTTTGQGMRTQVKGGFQLYQGAMRNVEQTEDRARLRQAGTKIFTLRPDDREDVSSFDRALDSNHAYLYHLAEGTDPEARQTFADLERHSLVRPALVGIHSLGLAADDLRSMGEDQAKVIWSPFSNLLLYGQTLSLNDVRAAELTFAIGCDWSPSGSKNLLQELKVAQWVAKAQEVELSSQDLLAAVTSQAAQILGWDQSVGTLAVGNLADLVVLSGAESEPYDQLISAREAEIRLVVVGGIPRFGERALLEELTLADELLEDYPEQEGKALFLQTQGSELNDLSLAAARQRLDEAMSDLPAFVARTAQARAELTAFAIEPAFEVLLDNEPEAALGQPVPALMADEFIQSLPLDLPEVGVGDYWDRLEAQPNLPEGLAEDLRAAYGD